MISLSASCVPRSGTACHVPGTIWLPHQLRKLAFPFAFTCLLCQVWMTWMTASCRPQLTMLRTLRMPRPCLVRALKCRRRLASCFRGCTPPTANLATRCICKSSASGATRCWSRQATNRPGAHTHAPPCWAGHAVRMRPSLRQCAHMPAARRHSRRDELQVGAVLGAPPAHALLETTAAQLTAIPRAMGR